MTLTGLYTYNVFKQYPVLNLKNVSPSLLSAAQRDASVNFNSHWLKLLHLKSCLNNTSQTFKSDYYCDSHQNNTLFFLSTPPDQTHFKHIRLRRRVHRRRRRVGVGEFVRRQVDQIRYRDFSAVGSLFQTYFDKLKFVFVQSSLLLWKAEDLIG